MSAGAATEPTLRRMIGLLGTLLPFVLLFSGYLSQGSVLMRKSISAYYYTKVDYLFVGIMLVIGAYLVCYRGHSTNQAVGSRDAKLCNLIRHWCSWVRDDGLTSVAGVLAILVAVLPTATCGQKPDLVNYAHWILAGGFLLSMAVMAGCQFTQGGDTANNRLYRVCAWVILAAILVRLGDIGLGGPLKQVVPTIVWWLEAIAVAAFGFSWLVKSEMVRTRQRQSVVGVTLLVLFLVASGLVPAG